MCESESRTMCSKTPAQTTPKYHVLITILSIIHNISKIEFQIKQALAVKRYDNKSNFAKNNELNN